MPGLGNEGAPNFSSASRESAFLYSSEGSLREGRIIVKVAADGSCSFRTVQDAINAVPLRNKTRTIIHVAPGVYRQPIYIPKTKNMITLLGDCAETTFLTWDNTSTRINHHHTSEIIGTGTFACGTVIVEGEDFIAQGITFENSSPKGSGQAVAIRVTADCCAFYHCRFLGWQDTAYLHYGRHYLRNCYIEGSVDFIFGNATALLEHCTIHCKSSGYITAQQRKASSDTTGYLFLRCVVTGTPNGSPYMYLGRPWAPHARVIFAYTWMDSCIKPSGWNNWNNSENEKTACFYEYRCEGPGSDLSQRVTWAKQLRDDDAERFLSCDFINKTQPWLRVSEPPQAPFLPVPFTA
ncbi:hypothetical protein KP509_17G012300 [Ceratopteris richardii]|uniref:Pectinesterase n=1 Tax=Ceratopteris richardii TaxID=49495 RepID=A0A8T2SVY5_CERRI|nr:hypothetical protein KP509_17G012300 [Ceratopteris richardii]KAH7372594.1 hypothetical protein KP509_17G012300 [Ceratopteris richardii]KAH7372595.1 hypothetical protein KP509_17G012300 [Ceratopteris richardii]